MDSIPTLFAPHSAYERYARSLRDAGLEETALGRAWFSAGVRAFSNPQPIEPPFREVVYFDPSQPGALGYRLKLKRGQELTVRAEAPVPSERELFLELFEAGAGGVPEPGDALESAQDGLLEHSVHQDGTFVVRLQPELLHGGRWTLTVSLGGSLEFPVAGGDSGDIGSRFGDPRDGGRRRHEGVDIFAPRGTRAVAAADGYVVRAGTSRLGGKTVWMRASDRSLSFYYAHLDRRLVSDGERVQAGDPVGLVGNTGNAVNTPPHLHFGVFSGSALDPYPFLHTPRRDPPAVTADLGLLGTSGRVRGATVNLRRGPSTRTEIVVELPRYTLFHVRGATRDWFRVVLPDGTVGFVLANLAEPVGDRPIGRRTLEAGHELRFRATLPSESVGRLEVGTRVEVLGRFGDALYVTAPVGLSGWITG